MLKRGDGGARLPCTIAPPCLVPPDIVSVSVEPSTHAPAAHEGSSWLQSAASPSTATEVAVFRHPDELPADAQALLEQAERFSPQLGADWYRNYLGTVARAGDVACFHVLRRGAQALAVWPVQQTKGGLPWHRSVEALGNYYTCLYAPALAPGVDGAALVPLVRDLVRIHKPLGELRLQPLDPLAPSFAALMSALRGAGLVPIEYHCFGNWYLRPAAGGWAAYLAQRSSKQRSNIKRMEKKLQQDGAQIEILVDPAQVQRGAEAYEAVYAASWKKPEPYPQFLPGLIAASAARGWMRLGVVWLKGRPIAAQLWLVAQGRAEIYKVAYDEAFKEYSPGTVLTARLLQHVIDTDHVVEVDYLVGDDPYKRIWMDERRVRCGIVAYNPRTLAGWLGLARERAARWLGPLRERLRSRHHADPAGPAATDAERAAP